MWADRASRLLFHRAPAALADAVLPLFGSRPFLSRLSDRMDRATSALEFFTTREWRWDTGRADALMQGLEGDDANRFGVDISGLDWEGFIEAYVLGTRYFF